MWASKPADSGLVVEFAEISADAYMENACAHDWTSQAILLFFVGLATEETNVWPLTTTVHVVMLLLGV